VRAHRTADQRSTTCSTDWTSWSQRAIAPPTTHCGHR
jgi:hypothetical protein